MLPYELLRQQQKLAPKADLSAYDGQWVALRNGYVVASGSDPAILRSSADVQPHDALILVCVAPGHLIV